MKLSNTDSAIVKFGKKAVLDKSETKINTGTEQKSKGAYYKIVRTEATKEIASFYYNIDTEKRKNAYQEMNRILAEG